MFLLKDNDRTVNAYEVSFLRDGQKMSYIVSSRDKARVFTRGIKNIHKRTPLGYRKVTLKVS